jgi:multidrug efflux system membrane fusion protein
VTITQTRPISLIFTLPEDALQGIVKEMALAPLPVAALSRDGRTQFDLGELTLIDNAIDQATGTIRLKATLPNENGQLWPGQFVLARLQLTALRDVLTVPSAAIQNGPEGRFVYLVKDGAVEVRKVTLGQVDPDIAVVQSGLEEGDLVVTSGHYRLQPGSKIAMTENPRATPFVAAQRN